MTETCLLEKWRLLLPGASEPRLTAAKTARACRLGYSNRLRGLSNRSIVVVGNYEIGPITAEPCRAKACPLRPRRSYFAPAGAAPWFRLTAGTNPATDGILVMKRHGWRRRVLPPGPMGLLRQPFIAIVRVAPAPEI